MPRITNPYGPATPIGSGLRNLSGALLAGRGRAAEDDEARRAAQAGMYDAHGELYREQARKATAEADLARRLLEARSYDSVTDVAAAGAEMPGYTFRSIHEANQGRGDLSQYTPEELARYRRALVSVMPGYADKTVDPAQIARALNLHREAGHRDDIIAGRRQPTPVSQAYYATSGKAPFDNSTVGTFNVLTGTESLNDFGRARIGTEQAHAGAYREQGNAASALARQRNAETTAGVRLGPPVIVAGEGDDIAYTSPLNAVRLGLTPGARPVDHRPPTPPRPAAPRKISGIDRSLFETSLNTLLSEMDVEALDPQTRSAVLRQAEQEWQNGAAGHGNAVKAALDAVAPQGLENSPWYNPFGRSRPRGGPSTGAPASATPQQHVGNPWRIYVAPSGKQYTEADVQATARNRGMTPQQVILQLRLREGA